MRSCSGRLRAATRASEPLLTARRRNGRLYPTSSQFPRVGASNRFGKDRRTTNPGTTTGTPDPRMAKACAGRSAPCAPRRCGRTCPSPAARSFSSNRPLSDATPAPGRHEMPVGELPYSRERDKGTQPRARTGGPDRPALFPGFAPGRGAREHLREIFHLLESDNHALEAQLRPAPELFPTGPFMH